MCDRTPQRLRQSTGLPTVVGAVTSVEEYGEKSGGSFCSIKRPIGQRVESGWLARPQVE
jgi:hypothetical protein